VTPEDCSSDGFCNENCSILTPDPDCAPSNEPQCDPVVSDFSDGDEGWTILGDAQGETVDPTFSRTDGNPGGHILAVDDITGGVWRFQAPQKYHGDFAAAYGQLLSFDLRQSDTDDQFSSRDVLIQGGGLLIWFDTPQNPGIDWTSYSIPFEVNAGWLRNNNAAATEAEIRTVLADITNIQIRGEFRSGPDTGRLDNVVLGVFCAPTQAPTLPPAELAGLFLVDANQDFVLRPLVNGHIIALDSFAADIQLSALAEGIVGTATVSWVLTNAETGELLTSLTDTGMPFTLSGETNGDINPVAQLLVEGRYRLTAAPFNNDGLPGESISVVFQVVDRFTGGTGNNLGTEFWIVELPNVIDLPITDPGDFAIVIINSAFGEANVELIHPNSGTVETFTIAPDGVEIRTFPRRGFQSSSVTTLPAYRVLSDADVVVYAFSPWVDVRSNDAALISPTASLGTSYRIPAYESPTNNFNGTVYAVLATEDDTEVQVFDVDGNLVNDETLNVGQVLQRIEAFDLSGYQVVADKPVAVFAGSPCTAAGSSEDFCDILYEQVIPEQALGSTYISCPSAVRPLGCSGTSCAPGTFSANIVGIPAFAIARPESHQMCLYLVYTCRYISLHVNGGQYCNKLRWFIGRPRRGRIRRVRK
jgi:hypothetical protein